VEGDRELGVAGHPANGTIVRLLYMLLYLMVGVCLAQTSDADTQLNLGLAQARSGEFDGAKNTFLKARLRFPSDARFPLELAGIAFRQSNAAEAKRLLRSALRLDPRNVYGNSFQARCSFLTEIWRPR
jgi:tetratricopeptide (TPR) repeat protein